MAGSAALQAPDWSRFQLPNRLLFHAFTGPRDRLKNDPESVPMAYLKPVRHNVLRETKNIGVQHMLVRELVVPISETRSKHIRPFLASAGGINFRACHKKTSSLTSMAVLESILRENVVWFSNPLFMNDLEEVRFGINE